MYSRLHRISIYLLVALIIFSGCVPAATNTAQLPSDDAQWVSIIVWGEQIDQVAQLVEQQGGKITSRLEVINGVGALVPIQAVTVLRAADGVAGVAPNSLVVQTDTISEFIGAAAVPATNYPDVIGADRLLQQGINGQGVGVAVIDSGAADHQSIRDRIVAWQDFVEPGNKKHEDPNGHGTHIASIIANEQTGSDNEMNGVSPAANLVIVRVLDENGYGTYERLIQGIDWVLANQQTYNIRVLNLSLQAPVQSPYWSDPINLAVMRAWQAGIVVVAAAGNSGPDPMTIAVPGNNPYVITVGAFTDHYTPTDWSDDYLAPFSAAGPTPDGFAKPDILAPGAHMVAAMMPDSKIAKDHEAFKEAGQYFSMSGTSQAAGVVSGLVALMLQKHPQLSPDQVKYRLMNTALLWVDSSANPNDPDSFAQAEALYSIWQQGAGRVNAPDAVLADVDPLASANQGMDLAADLTGPNHYEGFSEYDAETGQFVLRGDYHQWAAKYGVWSGGYGVWSGKYGVWSGGYGVWSGKYGVWSGGYGVWSGGYGVWSGGYGVWSGGYGVWSGGYGVWSGSGNSQVQVPWDGTVFDDPVFAQNYHQGNAAPDLLTSADMNNWVQDRWHVYLPATTR